MFFYFNTKKASVDYKEDFVKISCFLFPFWRSWWFFPCFFLFVIYLCYIELTSCSIYRHVFLLNDKKFDIIILKEGVATFFQFGACILFRKYSAHTLFKTPIFFNALLRIKRLCWINLSACVCCVYISVCRWIEIRQWLTVRGNRVINLNFIFLVIFLVLLLFISVPFWWEQHFQRNLDFLMKKFQQGNMLWFEKFHLHVKGWIQSDFHKTT